ncbi:hypothetical protein GCM10020331_041930 [Ectobacillus funiculus]
MEKEELADTFSAGTHGTTFGGNMIAMSAAKAVLENVMQPEFLESVTEKKRRTLWNFCKM